MFRCRGYFTISCSK